MQTFAVKKAQEQVFSAGLAECTGLPIGKDAISPREVERFANAIALMYPQKKPANPFI